MTPVAANEQPAESTNGSLPENTLVALAAIHFREPELLENNDKWNELIQSDLRIGKKDGVVPGWLRNISEDGDIVNLPMHPDDRTTFLEIVGQMKVR